MATPRTVGEDLLQQVSRIAESLEVLTKKGLPRSLLILWLQKKTHLSQRDIQAVLDALAGIEKEFQKPLQ